MVQTPPVKSRGNGGNTGNSAALRVLRQCPVEMATAGFHCTAKKEVIEMHEAVAIVGVLVVLAVLGSLAWTVGRLAHEYLDAVLVSATSPLPTLTSTPTSTSTPPPTSIPTLTPTLHPTSTPASTFTPTPAW